MKSVFERIRKNSLVHRILVGTPWRGIYSSFAAAQAAIPAGKPAGYDNPGGAAVSARYALKRRRPTNYAAFFHIRPLLKPGVRIFDFGGGIGVAYYAFHQYMPFPSNVEWTVCEVKNVIEVGKRIAIEQQATDLRFTDSFQQADGCDVLISAGALQYVEAGVADLLSTLSKLPPYLLLNRIPVWDRDPLFTLQTIDSIVCPYKIFNRGELIASLKGLGYRLMDSWECPESTFSVRFHLSLRLNAYQGFYFVLPDHAVDSAFPSEESQPAESDTESEPT